MPSMKERKIKIIATIGPGSNYPEILNKFKERGVDFFRINLSHTDEEDIEQRIKDLLGYGVPIILDTEGPQVRSGNNEEINLEEGKEIKIFNRKVDCNNEKLFLRPLDSVEKLKKGDILHMDFEFTLLKVTNVSTMSDDYITCKIIKGGAVGSKKGIHIEGALGFPALSQKDKRAIELAKKYGIKNFTLSFIRNAEEVKEFKEIYPEATVYSKIECNDALQDLENIIKISDGVLIDRGDLSREVKAEQIPFIKKSVLKLCKSLGKPAIVATNTLEGMSTSLRYNQAEINDVANILLDGAEGIALTKETAVGKYPLETVSRLAAIIKETENFMKKIQEQKT